MQILVADDDPVGSIMLTAALKQWAFDVTAVRDGGAALERIQETRPPVAIVDWMMPGLDGPSLCRRIRADAALAHMYVILLTARQDPEDIVRGLEAGADDYVTKPFRREELKARVNVGVRVATLQQELAAKVTALEQAVGKVRALEGLLPICAYCKKIRTETESWEQMEQYISTRSAAVFSHSVCPTCLARMTA